MLCLRLEDLTGFQAGRLFVQPLRFSDQVFRSTVKEEGQFDCSKKMILEIGCLLF